MFDVFVELKHGQQMHFAETKRMRAAFAIASAWLEDDDNNADPADNNPALAVVIIWRGEKPIFRATRWEWRQ